MIYKMIISNLQKICKSLKEDNMGKARVASNKKGRVASIEINRSCLSYRNSDGGTSCVDGDITHL